MNWTPKKHVKCPFCNENFSRVGAQTMMRCLKCGATEKSRGTVVRPDPSRTMAKVVTDSGFKVRLVFEPRNLYFGLHWDLRPSGLNIWVNLLPLYTIQIVFGVPKERGR